MERQEIFWIMWVGKGGTERGRKKEQEREGKEGGRYQNSLQLCICKLDSMVNVRDAHSTSFRKRRRDRRLSLREERIGRFKRTGGVGGTGGI